MKRTLKIILIILLLLLVAVSGLFLYSKAFTLDAPLGSVPNTTGLVQAHGQALYDAAGMPLQLRGINAGQILLQEGWMSPFALEPMKNADGSYVKDKDGNLQYPEFTEEEFRAGIKANPNLNAYDMDALMQMYWDCFFTAEDFRIIKEDLQMNTIRGPGALCGAGSSRRAGQPERL